MKPPNMYLQSHKGIRTVLICLTLLFSSVALFFGIGIYAFTTGPEIARNSVESQRLSTLIDYATAAPFAIDFLETAFAIEDSNSGIWRWPITLRNWRSATSNPEPTHRSI